MGNNLKNQHYKNMGIMPEMDTLTFEAETGLTISHPHLCGVKQFPLEEGRYIVFLFETEEFEGDLRSSEEGTMHWIDERELSKVNLVEDFEDLIEVMLDDELMEFQYVIEDGEWLVIKR